MSQCSITDCESGANQVYCPNRFTGHEMITIKTMLEIAINDIEEFIDNYEEYENTTYTVEELEGMLRSAKGVENKVQKLLKNAGIFFDTPV